MANSRDLTDFTREVKRELEKIAKGSDFIYDLLDEFRESTKYANLADGIIEDIFTDADEERCLFDRDDRFSTAIIDDAVLAVIGVCAPKVFDRRYLDDLGDKTHDSIEEGIRIYEDCLDNLEGDRDRGRSRDRDRGRGRDRDRDRDRDRGSRHTNRSRSSRGSSRSNNGASRGGRTTGYNNRRGSEREERTERKESTNRGRANRYGRGVIEREDNDTKASALDLLGINPADLTEYIENRKEFKEWLANGKPTPAVVTPNKNVLKNNVVGVVLDKQHDLVDGVVVPMEHYMEHELNEAARKANMARYGIKPAKAIEIPKPEERETFLDTHKLSVESLDVQTLDRVSSDMIHYSDLAPFARRQMHNRGQYVMTTINHSNSVGLAANAPLAKLTLPNNFYEAYQYIKRVRVEFETPDEIFSTAKRFFYEYDTAATLIYNQCLSLVNAGFLVENFADDYLEAEAAIEKLSSYQRELYNEIKDNLFNSMLKLTQTTENDRTILSLNRSTPALWVESPLDIRLTNAGGYNQLTARTAPELYKMIDSALNYRNSMAELIINSGSPKRYVANIARALSGAPIIIREL